MTKQTTFKPHILDYAECVENLPKATPTTFAMSTATRTPNTAKYLESQVVATDNGFAVHFLVRSRDPRKHPVTHYSGPDLSLAVQTYNELG